jgi:hypothetical protein
VKLDERRTAIELLQRHPGWSDRRVADVAGVAPSTVSRWRWEQGLAPALKRVGGRRRREQAVKLGEARLPAPGGVGSPRCKTRVIP